MKLLHYIQGFRLGKDAHRLELEAMEDPFLADALEGYDEVSGNHKKQIEKLQRRIMAKAKRKPYYLKPLSIAASILIIIGIGTFFLLQENHIPEEVSSIAFQAPDYQPTVTPAQPLPAKPEKKEILAQEKRQREQEPAPVVETVDTDIVSNAASDDRTISEDEIAAKEIRIAPPADIAMSRASAPADSIRAIQQQATVAKPAEMLSEVAEETTAPSAEPKPVDGNRAYNKYLKDNLVRPTDDDCKDAKGKVVVTFRVNAHGRPHQIRVTKGLCHAANQEAIRLVSNGPSWTLGDKEVTVEVRF